jgi:hypothetical protein
MDKQYETRIIHVPVQRVRMDQRDGKAGFMSGVLLVTDPFEVDLTLQIEHVPESEFVVPLSALKRMIATVERIRKVPPPLKKGD